MSHSRTPVYSFDIAKFSDANFDENEERIHYKVSSSAKSKGMFMNGLVIFSQIALTNLSSEDIESLLVSSPGFRRRLDRAALSSIHLQSPVRPSSSGSSNLSAVDLSEIRSVISTSSVVLPASFPKSVPLTVSGDYGWVSGSPCLWRRPKVTREIVKYSEAYFAQNGYNPYQKNSS